VRRARTAKRLRWRTLVPLALVTMFAVTPLASASEHSPIEGVWSFNGGAVAITSTGEGSFVGTVVTQTEFAQCPHPVEQKMWTDIRQQPDGSYWGSHQWYFETAQCTPNPQLGPTAWRVMKAPDGAYYLLVCFSAPGQAQPTISPDGSTANVSHPPCVQSALVAPLTSVAALKATFTLPESRKCLSRRAFTIHVLDPRYDPLRRVAVTLAGHRVTVRRHKGAFAASIDLRGLPKGQFTVTIHAVTVLGHKLVQSRQYHTCIAKLVPKQRSDKSR
jgi:hypothetical protein